MSQFIPPPFGLDVFYGVLSTKVPTFHVLQIWKTLLYVEHVHHLSFIAKFVARKDLSRGLGFDWVSGSSRTRGKRL